MKRKFSVDEVINLMDNCYYVTADDVIDLCDLRDIGFENVRWVKDIFEEFGGCWIAEKDESDVDGDKHGGMLVCLSVRVGRMLTEYASSSLEEYCENNVEVQDRDRVEELMFELNNALDNWNGDNKKKVNRIILLLEDLKELFLKIREKQGEIS